MKKTVKRIIASLLVVIMVITAAPLNGFVGLKLDWLDFDWLDFSTKSSALDASGSCGKNATYTFDESTGLLTISGTGFTMEYSYKSSPFDNNSLIKTVVIENGITHIGHYLFSNCYNLTSVKFGNSVFGIFEHAFINCTSLTSVSFGNNLHFIGDFAFSNCTSLSSVTIPNSVKSIHAGAFDCCKNLKNLTLGNSIEDISDSAFSECTSLTNVIIPNSVKQMGRCIFWGCTSLTSVTIGNGVISVGFRAFFGCKNLSNIVVDSNNSTYDSRENCNAIIKTKTNELVFGCNSTVIPDSVTSIADNAFDGIRNLESITIPKNIMSIGLDAFEGCTNLSSIIVDKNNRKYDSRENCNAIIETETNTLIVGCKNTVIPNNVTSIATAAFASCVGLTSIIIPDSVTSIGNVAFEDCNGLTSIEIPPKVTIIDIATFESCGNLTSVTIPDSVTSIGYSAFDGCNKLKDVYYSGLEEDWNNITIGARNEELTDANIHFKGFSARTAWSFPNTGSAFTADDGNTGKYYIHEEVYKEVFGQSFVDNVTLSKEWGGNCFGMSVSSIMFYLGKLDWNTCCGNKAISINEYVDGFNEDFGYTTVKRSSECVKYIERYQILGSVYENKITISEDMNNGAYLNAPETNTLDEILKNDSYKIKYASYSDEFNTYLKDFYLHNFNQYPKVEVKTHNPNGDYIKNLLEKIKNSDKPIGIGINGTSDHMMILRTDKECEDMKDGWTRVYVYDPNHPYMPEEYSDRVINPNYCNGKEDNYYIELNPSENKWRYYGGERTDDNATYCGCDKNGNVKYQFDYTDGLCTLQPDRICLTDLSILPTEFNGTEQWMENEGFIKSLINNGAVVKGYNDNELVVSLQDNHLVCKDEVKKANCYHGNEEAAESGSFIIPNDDYTFTISGGNIDFISNDCVFSVQSDNEVEFSIDNKTNTLIITAKEDSAIETKVSFIESNAKYQSGIVTGQISKGETVEISIDSKEISAESSKNDSLLNFSYKTESTEKTFVDEVKDNPRIDIAVIKNSKVNSVIIDDIEVKYKNTVKLTPTIDCDEEIEYTTTYTSSNPDVVTVDKDGNITTHKKGSATITCTVTDEYGNVVKDTCNVNVTFSFGQWLIWILLLGFLWY